MLLQATMQHLKALIILENEIFSKDDFPLSAGSFYYHIKKNDLFVYLRDNEVVGYILWLKRKGYYRLYSLGVSRQHRGVGIAQDLLEYSFKHLEASTYTLEAKTTNISAIALYEKYGFTKEKILTGYYPNHLDGYLMVKKTSTHTKC